MQILATTIPIFLIIALGWLARRRGHLQPEFLEPANRLVYHLALPAMVFRAIAVAPIRVQFDSGVTMICVLAVLTTLTAAWLIARHLRITGIQRGGFIQNAVHGNLGYVGLAVAFYHLGDNGLARAGIIAGFIMILQNFVAVCILQLYAERLSAKNVGRQAFLKIVGNPIILSAMLGIGFSVFAVPMPVILDRSLEILGHLALPLALLLIGSGLSFHLIRRHLLVVLLCVFLKLVFMPAVGLVVCRFAGIGASAYLPGLILLASPTATVTYVMARELRGDADFAVASISASTLISAATFTFWLTVAA
jgi:predicted permease